MGIDLSGYVGGEHVLLHALPGWIIAGTVIARSGDSGLVLRDAVWLDITADQHCVFEMAAATTAKQMKAIAQRYWRLPDGVVVQPQMIMGIARDVRPLACGDAASAVATA